MKRLFSPLRVIGFLVFVVLLLLLVPHYSIHGLINEGRKTQARNDLMQAVTAIKAFNTEYSRYPDVGKLTDGDREISGLNQKQLFKILRNIKSAEETPQTRAQNSRGIVFFEGRLSKQKPPKGGFDAEGTLFDPWGGVYRFVIDADYDGSVTVPKSWNTRDSGKKLQTGVIGFSPGPDANNPKDDVTTWQDLF